MKLSLALASLVALASAQNSTSNSSTPIYKDPKASIDDRVSDLLKRMTIEEKTSQLLQADIRDYLNLTDGRLNQTGLAWAAEHRANSIWTGLYATPETISQGAKIGQDYLVHNTTLGEFFAGHLGRLVLRLCRYSGLHPERGYSRLPGPQCHHLQLANCHGLLVEPSFGRGDGQGHCR